MKAKNTIIILCFAAIYSMAQQMPLQSQYMRNLYQINPAFASFHHQTDFFLTGRSQWNKNLKGAPETLFLNAAHRNGNSILGGAVFFDTWGNSSLSGAKFTYVQDFVFHPDNFVLTLGLSWVARQFSVNQSDYVYFDSNDPSLTGAKENFMNTDIDFGLLIHGNSYSVGISTFNLLNRNIVIGTNASKHNTIERMLMVYGDYNVTVSDKIDLKPSLLYRLSPSGPDVFDVNVDLILLDDYHVGLSWRSSDAVSVRIGLNYGKLMFGYAYDMYMNPVSYIGKNAHEVMIGYLIENTNFKSF